MIRWIREGLAQRLNQWASKRRVEAREAQRQLAAEIPEPYVHRTLAWKNTVSSLAIADCHDAFAHAIRGKWLARPAPAEPGATVTFKRIPSDPSPGIGEYEYDTTTRKPR